MPLYEYECENGHRFEEFHSMDDRNNVVCSVCQKPARLRISRSDFRFAEPLTIYQELPGGRGYQEIGWKPDSGISPKPGQPYKTAKEVVKEDWGGVKEV